MSSESTRPIKVLTTSSGVEQHPEINVAATKPDVFDSHAKIHGSHMDFQVSANFV
jgi:hypothetical protein